MKMRRADLEQYGCWDIVGTSRCNLDAFFFSPASYLENVERQRYARRHAAG
jgi:hypothetical protein